MAQGPRDLSYILDYFPSWHDSGVVLTKDKKYYQPPEWWVKQANDTYRQRLTLIKKLVGGEGYYKCTCGKYHIATIQFVDQGNIKSCGCSRRKTKEHKLRVGREKQARYRKRHKG